MESPGFHEISASPLDEVVGTAPTTAFRDSFILYKAVIYPHNRRV
jgi:hypothetical protein